MEREDELGGELEREAAALAGAPSPSSSSRRAWTLAGLLAHVPHEGEVLVRYYGAISVRRRAAWRQTGILRIRSTHDGLSDSPTSVPEDPLPPTPEGIRAVRRRWAELWRRVWDVDVSKCPKCGTKMSVLAFTFDPAVIASTLRHIRDKGLDPRAGRWTERPPPHPAGDLTS
jgi:hypothetical protein